MANNSIFMIDVKLHTLCSGEMENFPARTGLKIVWNATLWSFLSTLCKAGDSRSHCENAPTQNERAARQQLCACVIRADARFAQITYLLHIKGLHHHTAAAASGAVPRRRRATCAYVIALRTLTRALLICFSQLCFQLFNFILLHLHSLLELLAVVFCLLLPSLKIR